MAIKHLLSARQFDKKTLQKIFYRADLIQKGKYKRSLLENKIMATLFYEPSTRTRMSFEAAMQRLGGRVISTESASEFSSAAKGETLEDTIRVINNYCDVIVLRHPTPGASKLASEFSKVPIINAGDGHGEHPSQALLDAYTIFSKLKKETFTISMVGDLKYGRTIHSLCHILKLYKSVKIIFVSPKTLAVPTQLKEELRGINFSETENMEESIKNSDVIYMTRIQKERFSKKSDYEKYFGKYILDEKSYKTMKKKAIVMHPLPRVNEIDPKVDSDPRSIYFEEAGNGLFIRMALLSLIFDN